MLRRRFVTATLLATSTVLAGAVLAQPATVTAAPPAIADSDWLGALNAYRSMAGVAPVAENTTWSAQAAAHSCYMLYNGIGHDEIPGRPGYTAGGDLAGNNGNVAVHSSTAQTARGFIEQWVRSPLHMIGMLRPGLTTVGYGSCTNTTTNWKSAATLDVLRGIDSSRATLSAPVVFPGPGGTLPIAGAADRSSDRLGACGWSGEAGLPMIVMMPNAVTSASATLRGPSGAIDVCELHAGNIGDSLHKAIMGPNTVLLVPRVPLGDGAYQATVTSDGGSTNWSFDVDDDAPLVGPDPAPSTAPSGAASTFHSVDPFRLVDTRIGLGGATRLAAGSTTRIEVADASVTAVSANFVAVDPADRGYLTAFNCTAQRPTVSNINYPAGSVIANQTVVPLNNGDLCLFTRSETDVVIDVNGFYRAGSSGEHFAPVTTRRLFGGSAGATVQANTPVEIPVGGIAGDATAVSLNLTAINAPARGWLKVTPCGTAGNATISSLNYRANEVRSNSAVVPLSANGSICLTTLRTMKVTIDLNGYFAPTADLDFRPVSPIRLLDTRETLAALNPTTGGQRLAAGQVARFQVAGQRGIPAGTRAVSINIAATNPVARADVAAVPCGASAALGQLDISTEQFTIANGALAALSSSGELCLYTSAATHVIVDINGIWD